MEDKNIAERMRAVVEKYSNYVLVCNKFSSKLYQSIQFSLAEILYEALLDFTCHDIKFVISNKELFDAIKDDSVKNNLTIYNYYKELIITILTNELKFNDNEIIIENIEVSMKHHIISATISFVKPEGEE